MDIPRETIDALTALRLPDATMFAVLGIITSMLASKPDKGAALPADWSPSESDVGYGVALGLSEDQVYDRAEKMRLWAGANRNRAVARKSNWGLAFKGWLRDEAERCKLKQNGISRTSMIDLAVELGNRANGQQPTQPRTRVDEPLLAGFDLDPGGANGHARHR
jgi:hypothetical protein